MQRIREEATHGLPEKSLDIELDQEGLSEDESCDGAQYSPRIRIGRAKAPYLALTMNDQDGQGHIHWLLWNLPAREEIPRNLPKVAELPFPLSGRQGRNSFGEIGYTAVCPPKGERHRYRLRVFGLDGPVDLGGGSTGRDLERAMEGHILQYGEAEFHYDRQPPRPHVLP